LVAFILAGLVAGKPQALSFVPDVAGWRALLSPTFAVSLVYVSYAYSGWNAAAYLTGEIDQPQRNLGRYRGAACVHHQRHDFCRPAHHPGDGGGPAGPRVAGPAHAGRHSAAGAAAASSY
nr:hypothetical protein [Tanacetum cinerariifolium]